MDLGMDGDPLVIFMIEGDGTAKRVPFMPLEAEVGDHGLFPPDTLKTLARHKTTLVEIVEGGFILSKGCGCPVNHRQDWIVERTGLDVDFWAVPCWLARRTA